MSITPSQARDGVYQWVLLDLPVDALISVRTSLEWHVAEPGGDGVPAAHLVQALAEVNLAIEARTTFEGEKLSVWVRLVREGLTADAASLVTTGLFLV